MNPKNSCISFLKDFRQISDLRKKDVLVVYSSVPANVDENISNFLLRFLCEAERNRYHNFRINKDRFLFLYSRSLLRATLSKYRAVNPVDWEFRKNEFGKPEISSPGCSPPIHFNISHTTGLVAVAVSLTKMIGIDVECKRNLLNYLSISNRFFSPKEAEELKSIEDPFIQQRRFTEYWTLKEAYIKARGVGLSLSLDQICFQFDDSGYFNAEFGLDLQDDTKKWKFIQFHPSDLHCIAVAVNNGSHQDMSFKFLEVLSVEDELQKFDLHNNSVATHED